MTRLATIGAACASLTLACAASRPAPRPFRPYLGDRWIGWGIAYGPHRDGQRPGGPQPTRAQLCDDLELLRGRWDLLRLYGSDGPAADVLALVREERLPFKVLLGAWIAPETAAAEGARPAPIPGAREANRAQVEAAVRLANAYPDVVLAVVVGNETQVSWSPHRLPPDVLVGWIREARRGTTVPVGAADDFAFWVLPESARVAREVDLVVAHVHPLWNGRTLDAALAFTREKYAEIVRRHPGRPVVLGEVGWATRRLDAGEQGKLIRGAAGEAEQHAFYDQVQAWAARERITSTWFEAFDERWKGGPEPDDVEKHWGLFRSDRTPKAAVAEP